MLAIYKKEIRSYFNSVIGCLFIAFALAILSLYFYAVNLRGGYPYIGASLSSTMIIFLILIPILSMKCVAEERKLKTDQMLMTAPVSTWQIMLSKYLAMFTVFMIPVIVVCFFPAIMSSYGMVYMGMEYTSIFGFVLVGCLCLSVGLFISSITESQVIAAVGTFLILFVSYMAEAIAGLLPSTASVSLIALILILFVAVLIIRHMTGSYLVSGAVGIIGIGVLLIFYVADKTAFSGLIGSILSSLCMTSHFSNFISGIMDIPGIIYYISGSFLFLFLSVQAMEKRRWC